MKTPLYPDTNSPFRAKVTGRHAITLPAALCRELNIEVGDTIELQLSGRQAILRRAEDDGNESIRGILKDYFPDWQAIEQFISEERAGWDEGTTQALEPNAGDERRSPG